MLIKDIMDEIYSLVKENYPTHEEQVENIKRFVTLKALETDKSIVLEALIRLLLLEHKKAEYIEAKYQNLLKQKI